MTFNPTVKAVIVFVPPRVLVTGPAAFNNTSAIPPALFWAVTSAAKSMLLAVRPTCAKPEPMLAIARASISLLMVNNPVVVISTTALAWAPVAFASISPRLTLPEVEEILNKALALAAVAIASPPKLPPPVIPVPPKTKNDSVARKPEASTVRSAAILSWPASAPTEADAKARLMVMAVTASDVAASTETSP